MHQEASEILGVARDRIFFGNKINRRGNFSALSFGISYGGGQAYPRVLVQDRDNGEVLEGLLKEKVFARMSGFAAGNFFDKLKPFQVMNDIIYQLPLHSGPPTICI